MAFTTLGHHIDVWFLYEALLRTRADGAVGVDGQTAAEYAQNLGRNLRALLDRFKSRTSRAPSVREIGDVGAFRVILPAPPGCARFAPTSRDSLVYDHRLCRAVLGVFVRALLGFEQRRARVLGIHGRAGAVTAIQRCGSALNANPHFHTLVAEGVFEEQPDGSQRFVSLREPPSDVDVARLLAAVRGRIIRLLRRHDSDLEGSSDDERSDPLLLDSPLLAQLQGASVLGRVATGPRAGQRVLRLGSDPAAPVVTTGGPRHAHIEGFDLHANTAVRAGDNERLEHLCRYILRPPVAQDALELTPDGKVLLHLRRPWRDGTRAIRFEPSEFLGADLLRRVFAIDILACPDCGGRLRLLATIEERAVVEKILTHLGLPVDPPPPSAARTPAWAPGCARCSRSRARHRRSLARLTTHRRTPHPDCAAALAARSCARLRPGKSLPTRFP